MSGVFGKHARVREDIDEMMMAMRSYELRATEMGITAALKKCRGPISSMGSGAHCRESGYVLAEWRTLRQASPSPATVRPNVKQRNTPWNTQLDLGSGEATQGVPLAPRNFGNGLSSPGLHSVNPVVHPANAEFPEVGRLLETLTLTFQGSCSRKDGLNPLDFGDSSAHTNLHRSDRAIFPCLRHFFDTPQVGLERRAVQEPSTPCHGSEGGRALLGQSPGDEAASGVSSGHAVRTVLGANERKSSYGKKKKK